MQHFHVLQLLILISLTTLIEVHSYIKPGCSEYCGKVRIPYPFGIGRNCSLNEWFNVDCKSSTPYLSALNNMEVLSAYARSVTVNMSIVGADCKNPVQDSSNLVLSTSSHGKSPFLFSGPDNILVVEGCGSAAIMDKNGSVVSGCSTTCRSDTVSDINNCFGDGCCKTTIPHDDLESFTFSDGDGTCSGFAYLVNEDYAETFSRQSIMEEHIFVPISLSWDPNSIGCKHVCGQVSIPYPFGIGKFCSRNKWFNVVCKSSTPYLSAFNNAEVLGIDLEAYTVTVNVSKISNCKNPVQNNYNLFLRRNPMSFPNGRNHFSFSGDGMDKILVVEGCGSAAIVDEKGTIVSGCSTTCHNDTVTDFNNCFGFGCCKTTIDGYALYRGSFTFNLTGLERPGGNGTCSASAFLVDRKSFIQGNFSHQFAPITLSWEYSYDYDDASPECIRCEEHGGHCFPDRSGNGCHFHESKRAVILGVSISMGVLFLTVIIYALFKLIKKTRVKRRKQRCFKRNGGLLLKQQEATEIGLVDKTIVFTSNELEKATDHFNENRILGRGGQGTVYKGMLADGRIVAIKKSKVVDEGQLEQFINEVVILSQVNHRNVVKLLGCCLETEVPLLVSEFISNGTLYDLIQENEAGEFPFSLNLRLQIATEVAGAVSYLHSATSIPIYHRDIKTTNILLDEKYRAKVSDFGTSRFVSIDQTHLTTLVKGTFGYLDPEYFQSSQFTEKSDVYSFGVVLLELLTREKPISLTRFGENRSLATHFLLAMEEGRVMSIFDAMVIKEGSRTELLAVANLAMRCLNYNGRNRPTMKEVATELEGIRLAHVPSTIETNLGGVKHCEEVQLSYGESTSTSMRFDYNHSK